MSEDVARCQFIYYDSGEKANIVEIERIINSGGAIRDSLQELGFPVQTFIIHEVGDKLWMTVDGRFDVYEWRENHWENIYIGNYHGYNFNSQKFIYSGKLFSYRGYGFWRNHGEIIEFLPEKGEWEIIHSSRDLPYGIGYVMDSVFYIHSENCYEVELLNDLIRPVGCKYSIHDEIPYGREYIFQDYVLIASVLRDGSQRPLVEKESGDVYLSRRQPFKGLRDPRIPNSLVHIWGNEVTIMFPDDSIVKYAVDIELQYYGKETILSKYSKSWIWAISILLFLFIAIFLLYSKYRSRHPTHLEIISAFHGYEGKRIDSDALDKILGINDITVYETRKHKRASIIQEINTISNTLYNKPLIIREKNPNDKRLYLYSIQPL